MFGCVAATAVTGTADGGASDGGASVVHVVAFAVAIDLFNVVGSPILILLTDVFVALVDSFYIHEYLSCCCSPQLRFLCFYYYCHY